MMTSISVQYGKLLDAEKEKERARAQGNQWLKWKIHWIIALNKLSFSILFVCCVGIFWMNNKPIIEFGFCMIWRIVQPQNLKPYILYIYVVHKMCTSTYPWQCSFEFPVMSAIQVSKDSILILSKQMIYLICTRQLAYLGFLIFFDTLYN